MHHSFRTLLALVPAAALLAGCIFAPIQNLVTSASAESETRTLDLQGFTEIKAQSAFSVTLKQGDAYAVEVTLDADAWTRADIRVEGDQLVLGLKEGPPYTVRVLEATVTMPALEAVELEGAAAIQMRGFASDDGFEAKLSGASTLQGDLQADDIWLELAGSSRVTLEGIGGDLEARGSGASSLELAEFEVQDAALELSGASRATINAAGQLDVVAEGASSVVYVGNPVLGTINTSGASTVEPR